MSKPVQIETLRADIADVRRRLDKFESQGGETAAAAMARKVRTRQLIELGGVCRHHLPDVKAEDLDTILRFWKAKADTFNSLMAKWLELEKATAAKAAPAADAAGDGEGEKDGDLPPERHGD
jgi:hypothetical protein